MVKEYLWKVLYLFLQTLGTAACPPYHLAFVVGGTSAEFNLKTVKLASTKYLDTLPTSGIYLDIDEEFYDPPPLHV